LPISPSRLGEDGILMTCLEVGPDGSCLGNMFNTILPGSLGIAVYQDHYGGHYRKENSHPCNSAVEIQTPKSG
jgi:hypothetical protein